MTYLIDTNVLSQTIKPEPDAGVIKWWRAHAIEEFSISAITIHELRFGFELLPTGRRKNALEFWLAHTVVPQFDDRILPLDQEIADLSGRLLARARRRGHTANVADAMIAATTHVHGLRLATLNRKHFAHFDTNMVNL